MATYTLECCTDFLSFQAIRAEWEQFMEQYFPEQYGRTYSWLSSWWKTYHDCKPALVYIQRDRSDNRIVAAAPLFVCRENFGGFPVHSVVALGRGIGADDFLVSQDSTDFVDAVFADLAMNHTWHIIKLSRIRSADFFGELLSVSGKFGFRVETDENEECLVSFTTSFPEYMKSRSRKFRSNLNQSIKKLEKEGVISFNVLNPYTHHEKAWELASKIAVGSWQYLEKKSHFNETNSLSFYEYLFKLNRNECNEEFCILSIAERPIAYTFGCLKNGIYYLVDTAYHSDYQQYSLGRILFSKVIEYLIGRGDVTTFDLEGSGEYKEYYSNKRRDVVSTILYNSKGYASAIKLIRGSKLYNRIKDRVRNP